MSDYNLHVYCLLCSHLKYHQPPNLQRRHLPAPGQVVSFFAVFSLFFFLLFLCPSLSSVSFCCALRLFPRPTLNTVVFLRCLILAYLAQPCFFAVLLLLLVFFLLHSPLFPRVLFIVMVIHIFEVITVFSLVFFIAIVVILIFVFLLLSWLFFV
jgi:hypothetical protein